MATILSHYLLYNEKNDTKAPNFFSTATLLLFSYFSLNSTLKSFIYNILFVVFIINISSNILIVNNLKRNDELCTYLHIFAILIIILYIKL